MRRREERATRPDEDGDVAGGVAAARDGVEENFRRGVSVDRVWQEAQMKLVGDDAGRTARPEMSFLLDRISWGRLAATSCGAIGVVVCKCEGVG